MTTKTLYRALGILGMLAIWAEILMVSFGVRRSPVVVALFAVGVLLAAVSAAVFIRSVPTDGAP